MKDPSTLTTYHQKAICTLEMLQKAKDRVAHYKNHLKLHRNNHRMHFTWNIYRNENEIIEKIIHSHQVYQRIKKYYFNLITKIK